MTLASTPQEVRALRTLWQSMSVSNLDADIDHFLTVVTHLPGVIAPHVLLVERPGRPPMIVVGRLERHAFPVTVGYTEVLRPHLTTVVVAFEGILGAETTADLDVAMHALRGSLRDGQAEAVILQKVTVDSALHSVAVTGSPRICRVGGLPTTRRWFVALPDTLDLLLERRSVKARKEAHYESRRLRRKYDNVSVVRLDLESLQRVRTDIEIVARTTYQRALGVGASESALDRAQTALAFEHGRLRVWMLYIDDAPVAFWWGNLHGGTFAINTPGFDPRFAKDGVGVFVMHAMLDELCQDPSVTVADFGHGYAQYKERYASESIEQQDIILLAARPRPLLVGQVVALVALVNRLATRLLRDQPVVGRLRKRWRARLTRQQSLG